MPWHHSEQTKELLRNQRKGSMLGKRFFTDGVKDILCYPGEEPPGFVRGFTKSKWRNKNAS